MASEKHYDTIAAAVSDLPIDLRAVDQPFRLRVEDGRVIVEPFVPYLYRLPKPTQHEAYMRGAPGHDEP